MLRDDSALFADLGMHAMQTLYDLQAVETGDTQQLATLYARLLGALWLKSEQLASHYAVWSPASTPSAEQVMTTELLGCGWSHEPPLTLLNCCS